MAGLGDPQDPGIVKRVIAALHGEKSAATLEAYRNAGGAVYDVLADVEAQRKQVQDRLTPGERSRRVAVWNALVPQLLGESLMDADYAADPRTAGFLPPVTAEQVGRLFALVEPWLAVARRGEADPSFDLMTETGLPARLPVWAEAEPCPAQHLAAMITASKRLGEYAEAALADAESDPGFAVRLPRLRQLWAEADTAVRYANALLRPGANQELHEAIEDKLHRALETWFLLGQLAADPRLGEQGPRRRDKALLADPLSLPGGPNFDPWCLTDPATRKRWQSDRRAVRAIDLLWAYDPDPAATLTIQAEIDAALAEGSITARTNNGVTRGHYFCCPWSAVYQVRRPVRIARTRLHAMEQFVLDVSAEQMAEGGSFVRRIVRGPFHDTRKVDYCDPRAKHEQGH